jgi:hypothetical protein
MIFPKKGEEVVEEVGIHSRLSCLRPVVLLTALR